MYDPQLVNIPPELQTNTTVSFPVAPPGNGGRSLPDHDMRISLPNAQGGKPVQFSQFYKFNLFYDFLKMLTI